MSKEAKHIKIVDTIANFGAAEKHIVFNADFNRFLKAKYGKSDLLKVDALDIVKQYHLRGFTFGNYVTQEERYHFLFKIEKQLSYLAKITGNNNIGKDVLIIAFGVEGKKGSAAHYNADKQLINLNRGRKGSYIDVLQGENSFIHEYGHFLDFLQGREDKNIPVNFASETVNHKGSAKTMQFSNLVTSIEGIDSYMKILKNYKPKKFAKYLESRIEIFARIFESALTYYIVDNYKGAEAFFDVKKYGWDIYLKKDVILKKGYDKDVVNILQGKIAVKKEVEKKLTGKGVIPIEEKNNYPFSKEDIPYKTGYEAHRGTSFSPEKRAKQEQNEYFSFLASTYDRLKAKAIKTNRLAEFENNFSRFQTGYLKRYLKHLTTKQGLMSTMITGGSNFPVARMNKKNEVIHKRLTELVDYQEKAEKYILPTKSDNIKTGQTGSLDKLKEKLKNLEKLQETSKALNKLSRKYNGSKFKNLPNKKELLKNEAISLGITKPELLEFILKGEKIPTFSLTNNNAKINNVKKRILLEEKLQQTKTVVGNIEYLFDGGKVIDNYDINKIQIEFDGKPELEIRQFLKKRGHAFKWSPKNGVWQRQLNTYYRLSKKDLFDFLGVKKIGNTPTAKKTKNAVQQSLFN